MRIVAISFIVNLPLIILKALLLYIRARYCVLIVSYTFASLSLGLKLKVLFHSRFLPSLIVYSSLSKYFIHHLSFNKIICDSANEFYYNFIFSTLKFINKFKYYIIIFAILFSFYFKVMRQKYLV